MRRKGLTVVIGAAPDNEAPEHEEMEEVADEEYGCPDCAALAERVAKLEDLMSDDAEEEAYEDEEEGLY